jgi:predicted NAD/FAD-binding protein
MNIAIIGGGVSGLVTAHLLHRHHQITLFEAGDYAGGHTNTVEVEASDGKIAIDTGFIVFNDRNYPNFERLLGRLGVRSQPSEMSFGVSDGKGQFEYASTSIGGLYANRANFVRPWFQKMVADVIRFQRHAPRLLLSDDNPSLGAWLEQHRYSRAFIDKLIVPQAAAVWSSDPAHMWHFPARFLVEFFDNHGMLGLRNRPRWQTVMGGSARYVEAMIKPWQDRVRLATPVEQVRRERSGVSLTLRDGREELFDAVVFGAHSDQALTMLADPSRAEREILGAFPYQPNEAVLHTDEKLLPRRRSARASWNYHLLDEPIGKPAVTYDMKRLQALKTRDQYCVTLNRTEQIDPEKVIERISYSHPVYTPEGHSAQSRHAEVSTPENRTHYCGAYWGWGFHEDGVASAVRVAKEFGVPGL